MPDSNLFIHVTYQTLLGNHSPNSRTDSTYMSTVRNSSRRTGGHCIPPTLSQYRVQIHEHRLAFEPFHIQMPQDGFPWTISEWSQQLSEEVRWIFTIFDDLSILSIIHYSLNFWSEVVRCSGIRNHCKIDYIHTCNNRYRQEVYGAFFDHSILRLKNRSFDALKSDLLHDEYADFWQKIIDIYDVLNFSYNLMNPRYVLRDISPDEPNVPQEPIPNVSSRIRIPNRRPRNEIITENIIPQNQLADMMLNITLSANDRNSIYDMIIQNQISEVIQESGETTEEEDVQRGEQIEVDIQQNSSRNDSNDRILININSLRNAIWDNSSRSWNEFFNDE